MGVCASRPADKGEAEGHTDAQSNALTPGGSATVRLSQDGLKNSNIDISKDDLSNGLPVARDSYGTDEIQKPRSARSSMDAARTSPSSSPGQIGEANDDDSNDEVISPETQEILKEYTRLAEMLSYSPYPVTLIDLERSEQPYVFVNEVFLEKLGLKQADVIDRSWKMFLQTPYRHEIHSDVQERITEAFETDCEFREIAACYTHSGDIITFQLLFLPVSKDVDSGITHYVCIHIASEVTTKQARELDPSSPVALPKLPNSMGEIPTARHVSVTMKNYRPEMVLGTPPGSPLSPQDGSLGSLGSIRVGSFSGKPVTPKARRMSNLGRPAGPILSPTPILGPDPAASEPKPKTFGKVKSKAKSRFAPAGSSDAVEEEEAPVSPLAVGPLGNLRHDSALMGAITKTKGKQALPERVPRTKEEVWLQRMRNLLTSPLEQQ